MGISLAKKLKEEDDIFLFDATEVPEEIIQQILSWTEFKTLLQCRLVCKTWNRIICDPFFWKTKCLQESKYFPELPKETVTSLPFKVLTQIYKKPPHLGKNLIVNPFAIDNLNGWEVLSRGGDGWAFEKPPVGCDPVPVEAVFNETVDLGCFATSYHSCSKQQIIDLEDCGFIAEVLNNIPLEVEVRDWYAGRFDCGCVYEMKVELLNEKNEVLDSFEFRDEIAQWQGRQWHKVEARLDIPVSESTRFVRFYHGGTDTQFWRGHYGSKMTGSSVRIMLKN